MKITVLTASLFERSKLLAENVQCVARQQLPATAHLISVADRDTPYAPKYDALLRQAATEWVMFYDDDDLLDDNHLLTLAEYHRDADIVYTPPRHEGRRCWSYDEPFTEAGLRARSIVPWPVLARRELLLEAGGVRNEWGADWRLWQRCLELGARFVRLPQRTWTLRLNGPNLSWGEIPGLWEHGC